MADAAKTPTTTPAAMPATFVPPPLDCFWDVGEEEEEVVESAGRVMTIVVPGSLLVTTEGRVCVCPAGGDVVVGTGALVVDVCAEAAELESVLPL